MRLRSAIGRVAVVTGIASALLAAGALRARADAMDSLRTAADTVAANARVDTAKVSAAAFAFADTVRSRMAAWQQVAGHVEEGGTVSTWIAYLRGGRPSGIVETIRQSGVGTRRNEYFFDQGILRVFTSRGPWALTVPARERRPYDLRIAYDAKGDAIGCTKIIGGKPVALELSEAAGAQARASWLRELVRQTIEREGR
jgi:hypothetical protein